VKLYLLERNEQVGYNEYDSCVVCAKDEEEAKTIHPSNDTDAEDSYGTWTTTKENIDVTLLGTALKGMKKGVICTSFNAG